MALLTVVVVLRIGIQIMPTSWRSAVIAVTPLGREWLPHSCHRDHRTIWAPPMHEQHGCIRGLAATCC